MTGVAAALVLSSFFSAQSSGTGQNAAADAVAQFGRTLGIVFGDDIESAHLTASEVDLYRQTGVSPWLKSQIEHESDEITEPPVNLRRYVADHSGALSNLISILEKQSPDWGKFPEGDLPASISGPTIMIERVLLVVALINERDGKFVDADRALDASWSLARPVAATTTVWSQERASDIQQLQSGVLRKVKNPPLRWQSRLAEGLPWQGILAALPRVFERSGDDSGPEHAGNDGHVRALSAVADRIRAASPCGLAAMSDGDLWSVAEVELPNPTSSDGSADDATFRDDGFRLIMFVLRRAARAEVDRDLTLKVLELRSERQASADGRWPARLAEPASAVCPRAFYSYGVGNVQIVLRFEGSLDWPTKSPTLPLCFRAPLVEPILPLRK